MHFAWCKLAVGKLPVLLVVWSLWPTGIKLVDVTIMRIKNFVITLSINFFFLIQLHILTVCSFVICIASSVRHNTTMI